MYFCHENKSYVNYIFKLMRKFLTGFLLIFYSISLFSQISINVGNVEINNPTGLNKIYLLKNIDQNSTEIHYTSADASSVVKWYTFLNGQPTELTNISILSPTETYIVPVDNTGYIIDVDGVKTAFWVFDYSKYIPVINSITAIDGDTPCAEIEINLNENIPVFQYQNTAGATLKLKREFNLSYTTLEWAGTEWKELKKDTTLILPTSNEIVVPSPLTNTVFTLTGDEFATQLGLQEVSVASNAYTTKAVKCNITSITSTVRKEVLNENKRPTEETQLEGSAPLDINFYSNPTSSADTYIWKIYKDNATSPFISRSAKDNSYTFTEYGNYKVELTVSNQYCSYVDTLTVNVSESSLIVPKIFTPNDDGIQDEFRVAYQSIIEFNAVVVNRWGRRLYSWNNPAKGWDGTVNGKPVAEGPYYYIITAKGSDGKKYKLKGAINLLR